MAKPAGVPSVSVRMGDLAKPVESEDVDSGEGSSGL